MIIMKPSKNLLLTFCAVGVLAAANPSWAAGSINNCAQVTATTEGDLDSTPNNKADAAAILAAFTTTPPTNEDDEACAVLTVVPVYDLGDAPDDYKTLAASGGAIHEVIPGLMLGGTIDDEAEGQPGVDAVLDGTDEDGVNIPALTDGQALTLSVSATNTTTTAATLVCWIDYNGDKVFATDGSESGGSAVPAGTAAGTVINVLMPQVPATATADTKGVSYARCRLTTDAITAINPAGVATDGEVEDYKVTFAAQPEFDLALRKTLKVGQATSVQVGDTVTYTLEVLNQGGVDATAIEVVDYIPAGMELADGNWTANGDGSMATLTTPIPTLAAGATTTVEITLKVRADASKGVKENAAEISAAKDDKGVVATDVDSTYDSNSANETGKVDNTVDNTGGDEDDHDVADITVDPTVDLELVKAVTDVDGNPITTVRRGQTVKYVLTVTNKGPDDATGISITDKLPTNLAYVSDNSAGSYDAATGIWAVGALANGEPKSIIITATVK